MVEAQDLRTQLGWMGEVGQANPEVGPRTKFLAEAVHQQLEHAEDVLTSRGSMLSLITGSEMQAAREYLDAAAVNLLRLAPPEHIRSLLPNLLVEARRHL